MPDTRTNARARTELDSPEQSKSGEPPTPRERREQGLSLREEAPLESHAEWAPAAERADPVELIEEQNQDRIQWLVPVRRARMATSPFTFFRGAARIMACDLAPTPVSGIRSQVCGDAHVSNFGSYASPERRLVFDINDFDETLPGPWEWDVKRLAASLTICGRHNRLGRNEARKITRRSVRAYQAAMEGFSRRRYTDVWYTLFETEQMLEQIENKKVRKTAEELIQQTKRKDSRRALDRLAEEIDGQYRIRYEPPLLVPFWHLQDAALRAELGEIVRNSLDDYRATLPDDVELLLGKYRLVDAALKVVGVGSVGTRCFIALFEGRDQKDPLFLQIKEADKSVLEEHLPQSRYRKAGRRVVEGQRLMQAVSDIFLGWADSDIAGHQYYVRQLKDWKGSIDVDDVSLDILRMIATNRGFVLANAHARSGDALAISGYLGSSGRFADAITEFAESYADQNERDFEAFRAEIESGKLPAAELED